MAQETATLDGSPRYKRVLLKLSGEALCAPGGRGVAPAAVESIAAQFAGLVDRGIQIGVVVGAGNIIRGREFQDAEHLHAITGDYMGMLGTVINALALRDTLVGLKIPAYVVSAIAMPLICDSYFRPRVMKRLTRGEVILFAGGTSHPGVTTDMCAAIRASEIEADVLLKATKVDGIYDSDPKVNPDAKIFDRLTYEKALAERLGIMDLPAMAFCMERNLPILVFNMYKEGNLAAAVEGKTLGTYVSNDADQDR